MSCSCPAPPLQVGIGEWSCPTTKSLTNRAPDRPTDVSAKVESVSNNEITVKVFWKWDETQLKEGNLTGFLVYNNGNNPFSKEADFEIPGNQTAYVHSCIRSFAEPLEGRRTEPFENRPKMWRAVEGEPLKEGQLGKGSAWYM